MSTVETENASLANALNDDLLPYLIPTLVLEFFVLLVGTAGNVLVLHNYYHHFKRTTTWHLILTLALYDLFLCFAVQPLSIWGTFNSWVFTDLALCRAYRLLRNSAVFGTFWILPNIAADNYIRVCHPFYLVKSRTVKIICASSLLFTLPLHLPFALTIFGINQSSTSTPGVYVYRCSVLDQAKDTTMHKVYTLMFTFTLIGVLASFMVFYGLVLRKVREKKPVGDKVTSLLRLRFSTMGTPKATPSPTVRSTSRDTDAPPNGMSPAPVIQTMPPDPLPQDTAIVKSEEVLTKQSPTSSSRLRKNKKDHLDRKSVDIDTGTVPLPPIWQAQTEKGSSISKLRHSASLNKSALRNLNSHGVSTNQVHLESKPPPKASLQKVRLESKPSPQASLQKVDLESKPPPQASLQKDRLESKPPPQAALQKDRLESKPPPQVSLQKDRLESKPPPQASLQKDDLLKASQVCYSRSAEVTMFYHRPSSRPPLLRERFASHSVDDVVVAGSKHADTQSRFSTPRPDPFGIIGTWTSRTSFQSDAVDDGDFFAGVISPCSWDGVIPVPHAVKPKPCPTKKVVDLEPPLTPTSGRNVSMFSQASQETTARRRDPRTSPEPNKKKPYRKLCFRDQTSLTMFVVCMTFVACYLPTTILILTLVVDTEHPQLYAFSSFVLRTVMVQNAIHPVIYVLFNSKFREHVMSQLCPWKVKDTSAEPASQSVWIKSKG